MGPARLVTHSRTHAPIPTSPRAVAAASDIGVRRCPAPNSNPTATHPRGPPAAGNPAPDRSTPAAGPAPAPADSHRTPAAPPDASVLPLVDRLHRSGGRPPWDEAAVAALAARIRRAVGPTLRAAVRDLADADDALADLEQVVLERVLHGLPGCRAASEAAFWRWPRLRRSGASCSAAARSSA